MQHDFFAAVRDGVGVAFVAALADEVACVVVACKEGEQVVVHRRFAGIIPHRKGGFDSGRQAAAQVVVHVFGAAVHDAVDAEIEVGTVYLEDFPEFGGQFVKGGHIGSG